MERFEARRKEVSTAHQDMV